MPHLRRLGLIVVFGLVAAMATFSTASAKQDARTQSETGIVESIDTSNSRFALRTASTALINVSVPSSLDDHDDRRGRARRNLITAVSQLAVGQRVAVQGRVDNNVFVARRIEALRPERGRIEGTFVSFSVNDNKLTLNVNGANRVFTVDGNTRVRPVEKSVANLLSLGGGTRLSVDTRDGTTARVVRIA
jgi:hypothetical protein